MKSSVSYRNTYACKSAKTSKTTMQHRTEDTIHQTRIDENFKPYTVIDVLTKVYHRCFTNDLFAYAKNYPEELIGKEAEKSHDVRIIRAKVIRPESVFFQPVNEFYVDILVDAGIAFDFYEDGRFCSSKVWNGELRLRYVFDFRPCHMDCHFADVILDDNDSLINTDEMFITLDKYLLPYLQGVDYEILAENILERQQKNCLSSDVPFDPFDWIRNMGLKVHYGIFPDESILGEYFFDRGSAALIDKSTGQIYDLKVSPGTIVLNNKLLDNKGILNATATHESIHHYLGIYFFLLQKTHGQGFCSYLCKRYQRSDVHMSLSPIDIMELQANKLPGYLMIQKESAKERATKLLLYYGKGRSLDSMKRLVDDMSDYYRTTKVMMKTRLIEMGFTEVSGLTQTANGHLIPPYVSTLGKGETYTIDESDAIREFVENEEFSRIISSGHFVYAEGHFCLNDKKYVFKTVSGIYTLTGYARNHMRECCLVFKTIYISNGTKGFYGYLFKGKSASNKHKKYVGFNGKSVVTEEGRKLREQAEKEINETAFMSVSFNQATVNLMKSHNITVSQLAEKTGLSIETIKNLRNNPDMVFSIETIVAVCIAMQLPYSTSLDYIDMSPCKFLKTVDMKLYKYALMHWNELPVSVVNRKLVEADARPLTNLVDGFDENGRMLERA